jgi:hypothetical protein
VKRFVGTRVAKVVAVAAVLGALSSCGSGSTQSDGQAADSVPPESEGSSSSGSETIPPTTKPGIPEDLSEAILICAESGPVLWDAASGETWPLAGSGGCGQALPGLDQPETDTFDLGEETSQNLRYTVSASADGRIAVHDIFTENVTDATESIGGDPSGGGFAGGEYKFVSPRFFGENLYFTRLTIGASDTGPELFVFDPVTSQTELAPPGEMTDLVRRFEDGHFRYSPDRRWLLIEQTFHSMITFARYETESCYPAGQSTLEWLDNSRVLCTGPAGGIQRGLTLPVLTPVLPSPDEPPVLDGDLPYFDGEPVYELQMVPDERNDTLPENSRVIDSVFTLCDRQTVLFRASETQSQESGWYSTTVGSGAEPKAFDVPLPPGWVKGCVQVPEDVRGR